MAKSAVVWTATAVKQRKAILKYWTQKTHSTAYAEKLIKLINKRIRVIVKYPESWKLTSYPDSRISAMGNFSIVYKIADEGIIVTAFWDNHQEPDKLLQIISHTSKNKEELPEQIIERIKKVPDQLKRGLGKTSGSSVEHFNRVVFLSCMIFRTTS